MGKTRVELNGATILVTGSPGFIGANLVLRLLGELDGGTVVSLDNLNAYYDPALKRHRLERIVEAAKSSPARYSVYSTLTTKRFRKPNPAATVWRYSARFPTAVIRSARSALPMAIISPMKNGM